MTEIDLPDSVIEAGYDAYYSLSAAPRKRDIEVLAKEIFTAMATALVKHDRKEYAQYIAETKKHRDEAIANNAAYDARLRQVANRYLGPVLNLEASFWDTKTSDEILDMGMRYLGSNRWREMQDYAESKEVNTL